MKAFLKTLYALFPFKQKIFSLLKLIWKPGESVYRHLYFNGIINVSIGRSKSFKIKHYGYELENKIFWEGLTDGWEKESMKLWAQLCANADVCA